MIGTQVSRMDPVVSDKVDKQPLDTKRTYDVPSLTGTSCAHLDEGIFDDELMTGFVDSVRRRHRLTLHGLITKHSSSNPRRGIGNTLYEHSLGCFWTVVS